MDFLPLSSFAIALEINAVTHMTTNDIDGTFIINEVYCFIQTNKTRTNRIQYQLYFVLEKDMNKR